MIEILLFLSRAHDIVFASGFIPSGQAIFNSKFSKAEASIQLCKTLLQSPNQEIFLFAKSFRCSLIVIKSATTWQG